jgi:hypothetical protein
VTRAAGLLGVVATALVLASSAEAAAPNYILVSGRGLAHPVLLSKWDENGTLLSSLAAAPRARRSIVRGLARRPRFDLAEFWGWEGRPAPTRPREANQHGWFYPARRSRPAVFDVVVAGIRIPRVAPAKALRILARHGVPTRL